MSRRLFKSTVVVGSMTLISRLLGFVRDMLIARLFGVDLATDAFFVAFKVPNFLRRLFAEGAFAHAFVPVLTTYKEQGSKAALKLFIDKTAGTLAVCLLLILLFISLTAFAGSILNAHSKFAIPALTPVFLNICMIGTAIWLAPLMTTPVVALAWGVFIAGIVQMLFQIPALYNLGLLPRPRIDFKDAGVKRVIGLMLPAMFSVSVTQINLLLDTLIASFLTVGSVSWLYYSDRLVEFPLGILGLALGTVILPSLANNYAAEDSVAFSHSLDWGLRLVLLVGMPATIGLFVLAEPMLSTLFQYNEFTVNDVHLAGQSLKAYAVGLLGYLLIKVLVPAFTARQDVKTPVRYGIYAMIISLALNVALVFPLAHAGLALATSLGAFFNAALLLKKLLKDKVYQPATGWLLFFSRVLLASAAMTAALYYWVDASWWAAWSSTERVIHLLKWIVIGMTIYIATLLLTGLKPRHLTVSNSKP
ncbi:MAG: murein biosynthesis integral membrane protein MurJ [Methylococcaceae bacterium]|nr:murein biosynthesis integral membrane protein MurJ [Methylococcaceae bacterium]